MLPLCQLAAFVNVGDRAELGDCAERISIPSVPRSVSRKEAPSAQASLQANTRNLQVRVHQVHTFISRNKTRTLERQWLVCVGDEPSKLLVFQEGSKKSISAADGRYSFQVHQATTDAPYQLDKGVATEPASYDTPPASLGLQTNAGLLESPASIWRVPLEYILQPWWFPAHRGRKSEDGSWPRSCPDRLSLRRQPHSAPRGLSWCRLLGGAPAAASWVVPAGPTSVNSSRRRVALPISARR